MSSQVRQYQEEENNWELVTSRRPKEQRRGEIQTNMKNSARSPNQSFISANHYAVLEGLSDINRNYTGITKVSEHGSIDVSRNSNDEFNICRKDNTPRVVTGEKNSPTAAHAGRKRRPKWVPSAWGYSWATRPRGL
jgi:hypothetical protein